MRIADLATSSSAQHRRQRDLVGGSRCAEVGNAGRGGYSRRTGTKTGPHIKRAAMSDKSPRQTMAKKSGKSLKEKRAAKRAKGSQISQTETLLHTKKS